MTHPKEGEEIPSSVRSAIEQNSELGDRSKTSAGLSAVSPSPPTGQRTEDAAAIPVAPSHSPLPWKAYYDKYHSAECYIREPSTNGLTLAVCRMSAHPRSKEEIAANAEFIVRACNSHYELIEALKNVTERLDESKIMISLGLQETYGTGGQNPYMQKVAQTIQKAHAAIEKATQP